MKYLALLFFLFSDLALASGQLLFKPSHDYVNDRDKQIYGLQVDELLWKDKLKFVSWSEHGREQADTWKTSWYKQEIGLEFDYLIFGVGLGGVGHYNPCTKAKQLGSYATVSVQLWQ